MNWHRAAFLLATAPIAATAALNDRWEDLRETQTGREVTITTRDGKVLTGRFENWSATSIEIRRRDEVRSIAAADVTRVQATQPASRAKAALWGSLIGFGAAFPFGAGFAGHLLDRNSPRLQSRVAVGAGLGLYGAGIGAGIGALTGGSKSVVLYRKK